MTQTYNIVKIDTSNTHQVRQFLGLPFRIYRDNRQWVPPIAPDARRVLDRRKHPFYQHGEAEFLLAINDHDQVVGRLSVLENKNYNAFNHEHTAFFYNFESENDAVAARALFETAFDWARQRGLDAMIGPKGFTVFDGIGMLIKGFDHRPAFGQPYNPAYYPELISALGFEGKRDMVSGYLSESNQFPETIHQLSERLQRRRGLQVTPFKTRAELLAIAPHLKDLYNSSLAGVNENPPLTDQDVKVLANQLIRFSDPNLIKIIRKGDQLVGFLFAYPDISAALQRTRGRLFPFGWINLLLELRRTRWININGAGMVEAYRGLGGMALLFSEMYKSVVESGRYRYADLVQISTDNDKMQLELRKLGIDFYKTHRVYQRSL